MTQQWLGASIYFLSQTPRNNLLIECPLSDHSPSTDVLPLALPANSQSRQSRDADLDGGSF